MSKEEADAIEHAEGQADKQEMIVIQNIRNMTRRVSMGQIGDTVVVKELIVVEVDNGEGMALQSLVALAIIFVGVQCVSYIWKRAHKKSFAIASTSTLLLFPLFIAIIMQSWMFVSVWFVFVSAYTVLIAKMLLQRRPGAVTTNVYRGYRAAFNASWMLACFGYVAIAYGFFTSHRVQYKLGIYVVMYTMYFTLVLRSGFNYIRHKAAGSILPSVSAKKRGECGMCGEGTQNTRTVQLGCRDVLHEECIKNWKILGKKNVCPVCKERVDMSCVKMTLWQTNEHLFTQFLNFTDKLILAYAVAQGIMFALHI